MRPARGTASVPVPATAGVVRAGPGPETGGGCADRPRPSRGRSAAGGARAIRGPRTIASPRPRSLDLASAEDHSRDPRPRATHGGSPQPLARARRPVVSLRRRAAHPRRPLGGNGPAGRLRKAAPTYGAGCVRLPHGRRAARNTGALRQGHRGGKAVARAPASFFFFPITYRAMPGGSRGAGERPPRAAPRPVRPPGARETPPGLRPRGPRMRATAPKRRGPPTRPPDPAGRRHHSRGHGPAEG